MQPDLSDLEELGQDHKIRLPPLLALPIRGIKMPYSQDLLDISCLACKMQGRSSTALQCDGVSWTVLFRLLLLPHEKKFTACTGERLFGFIPVCAAEVVILTSCTSDVIDAVVLPVFYRPLSIPYVTLTLGLWEDSGMLNLPLSVHILAYLAGSAEPQSFVLHTMRAVLSHVAFKTHVKGKERQCDVVQFPVLTLVSTQLGQVHLFSLVSCDLFCCAKDSLYLLGNQNRTLFAMRHYCAGFQSHKPGTCVSRVSTLRVQPSC